MTVADRCLWGIQSVRRKGYVYIICSKNPKHKQRYVGATAVPVVIFADIKLVVLGKDEVFHRQALG